MPACTTDPPVPVECPGKRQTERETLSILDRDRSLEHQRGPRASQGRASFAALRKGRYAAASEPRFWLGLTAVTVLLAVQHGHDGGHGAMVMVSIYLASLVSSIAGFAFSAICGAILFHFHDDPVRIVQIMITCSIANQAAMTWAIRRDINWRELTVYFAGGAPGLAVGVWVLLNVDRALFTQIFGAFLLAYGIYMLVRKPIVIRSQSIWPDVIAGVLGGITGGAAGFPGAFVTIWCGMKGWDKARQRAVFQPFILIMQIAALLVISLARHAGASSLGFDIANLIFIPASLAGMSFGLALYGRMTDRQFGRAVNILLAIAGLSYIL